MPQVPSPAKMSRSSSPRRIQQISEQPTIALSEESDLGHELRHAARQMLASEYHLSMGVMKKTPPSAYGKSGKAESRWAGSRSQGQAADCCSAARQGPRGLISSALNSPIATSASALS
jgi:hypothetical protein